MFPRRTWERVLLLLFLAVVILGCWYEFGSKTPAGSTIKLGQTCPLSGPSAALGIDMMQGANAYFSYINKNGGINGRKIELITLDDSSFPSSFDGNAYKTLFSLL